MNADQLAMDRFGDFLKLLAQGCHVQTDDAIFAIGDGKTVPVAPMKIIRSSEYFAFKEEDRHWQAVSNRTLFSWFSQFRNFSYRVVYHPAATIEPIRQVRSIEL